MKKFDRPGPPLSSESSCMFIHKHYGYLHVSDVMLLYMLHLLLIPHDVMMNLISHDVVMNLVPHDVMMNHVDVLRMLLVHILSARLGITGIQDAVKTL